MSKNNSKKRFKENKAKEFVDDTIKDNFSNTFGLDSTKNYLEEAYSNKKKFYSIILILLMFGSTIGFIFVFSIYYNPNQNNNQNQYSEVAFQQFTQQGQTFWGAIRNSEEFIFLNISGFEDREDIENVAELIKKEGKLTLLVEPDFNSSESIYLIEKSLRALKIDYKKIFAENQLEENTKNLVLTKTRKAYPNSIVYSFDNFNDTEIMTYFLVK